MKEQAMRTNLLAIIATGLMLGSATIAQATPKIQHWQAPSGAQVYFVENHDLPMLDVAVNFPAGSAYESAEKSGMAGLTHGLISLGAEGMNEDDIARKLADIGAQMGGSFDADRSGFALRTLSNKAEREEALRILALVLQRPLFPETVLAREKTRLIAALKEAETKPDSIAAKAFSKAVFGVHPYGQPGSGDVSTVEKLQRGDLDSFYKLHYGAKNTVVALMGDISRAEAESIAQSLTSQLPAGGAAGVIVPVPKPGSASTLRIPHPATQSHILIGTPGVSRTDPDYFALYVGNYILGGGGFVSRLMQEVREKRGMAYSVYSYFMPMQQPGAFQIGLQTKKEQADAALQLVYATLREFIAKGVTEKELLAARQNIINGFPLRIDSNRKILEYLSVIGFYQLPLNYLDEFSAKVNKVTVAEISAAFKRKINPDTLATVIVGAPEENSTTGKAEGAQK
jgi:zinc protease